MTSGSQPTPRLSRRVRFPGGCGFELAGIVDVAAGVNEQAPLATGISELSTTPTPASKSPVLVFSHCFTCNKDLKAIVRISRSLAGTGATVLRYDMTGLGGSGGDFSWTNFTTNVADLRAAIRFASQELGPVVGLIGHSFGGAASLAVAGNPQDAAENLRAVATLAAPSETHHLATLMERRNPAIATAGVGAVEIGGRAWTIRREMLQDFRSHHLSELITRIALPLMVLHSPADETVGFEEAIRIYQLASIRPPDTLAPPVSLVALDRADHLLGNRAADLTYVAELLAAFFKRHHL